MTLHSLFGRVGVDLAGKTLTVAGRAVEPAPSRVPTIAELAELAEQFEDARKVDPVLIVASPGQVEQVRAAIALLRAIDPGMRPVEVTAHPSVAADTVTLIPRPREEDSTGAAV